MPNNPLCVRPRVLNSRCLTYFYICDLYTRRKKLFDFVLVRIKTESSPICLAKIGKPIFVKFCTITRLRNVMIYITRLLNIFSRFLFTERSNLPYSIWLLTQRSAPTCICVNVKDRPQSWCQMFRTVTSQVKIQFNPKKLLQKVSHHTVQEDWV